MLFRRARSAALPPSFR